jgi:hypothetical protein
MQHWLPKRFSLSFTLKAFVKTASSFEQLIKMWPAVENPFKGIVVAKLQIETSVNRLHIRTTT